MDGQTPSPSYIDDLVLRDRDANTDWNDDASDGTLEERVYYCQNWRHDVVALVTSGGALRERVRYTAYGIPVGMPQGDCDGDGDVDAADQSILLGAWGTATAKCDLNLDGTVDATDNAILLGQLGATAGFGRLSLSGNRFGYAGYASDPAVHADWHVRHRVLMSELGRWSRRDPIGYVDGAGLYVYVGLKPIRSSDPLGLMEAEDHVDCLMFVMGHVPAPPPGCSEAWFEIIANCCDAYGGNEQQSLKCARLNLTPAMRDCVQSAPQPPGAAPPIAPGACYAACTAAGYQVCYRELLNCAAVAGVFCLAGCLAGGGPAALPSCLMGCLVHGGPPLAFCIGLWWNGCRALVDTACWFECP